MAEREVLTSANEDCTGLWEAVWGLRAALPGKSEAQLIDLARRAIISLVERGFIYLCYFRHVSNEESKILAESVASVLAEANNWQPPSTVESTYVAFCATTAGELAWQRTRPH